MARLRGRQKPVREVGLASPKRRRHDDGSRAGASRGGGVQSATHHIRQGSHALSPQRQLGHRLEHGLLVVVGRPAPQARRPHIHADGQHRHVRQVRLVHPQGHVRRTRIGRDAHPRPPTGPAESRGRKGGALLIPHRHHPHTGPYRRHRKRHLPAHRHPENVVHPTSQQGPGQCLST